MNVQLNRPEWNELVTGQRQFVFTNFVLQLKVDAARKSVAAGFTTVDKAVAEIQVLCLKYQKAVEPDMKRLFA